MWRLRRPATPGSTTVHSGRQQHPVASRPMACRQRPERFIEGADASGASRTSAACSAVSSAALMQKASVVSSTTRAQHRCRAARHGARVPAPPNSSATRIMAPPRHLRRGSALHHVRIGKRTASKRLRPQQAHRHAEFAARKLAHAHHLQRVDIPPEKQTPALSMTVTAPAPLPGVAL